MLTMLPTEDERSRIQDAQAANPDLPLGSAEQFLLTLASISELPARLKLWAFKLDFENSEKVSRWRNNIQINFKICWVRDRRTFDDPPSCAMIWRMNKKNQTYMYMKWKKNRNNLRQYHYMNACVFRKLQTLWWTWSRVWRR